MTDSTNLVRIIQQTQPDEIYNLAAQSRVAISLERPGYTANADGLATLRLLEAIRILDLEQKTRFYQASTSELYGLVQETPQTDSYGFELDWDKLRLVAKKLEKTASVFHIQTEAFIEKLEVLESG